MPANEMIVELEKVKRVLNGLTVDGIENMKKVLYSFDTIDKIVKVLVLISNESKLSSTVSPTEPEKTE